MSEELVGVEVHDHVAVVTLDDPGRRNALSYEMTQALARAVREMAYRDDIGALVITATPPVFCAGGSLDDLLSPQAPLEEMYAGFVAVAEAGVPTVAAVNGPALGAGVNLALACDVVLCSRRARFETRFLNLGLHPGGGHLWRLRERIGRQGAAAMALFGEAIDGEEAARRGLVWSCHEEDDLLSAAIALATRAASNDRPLVTEVLATLDASAEIHTSAEAVGLELAPQRWSMERPEFASALAQMRERIGRSPSKG